MLASMINIALGKEKYRSRQTIVYLIYYIVVDFLVQFSIIIIMKK